MSSKRSMVEVLSDAVVESRVQELSRILADTYVLSVKTQNYHWHVQGPTFYSLHALFESQYRDLVNAIDLIAERIRALDYLAPGSMHDFLAITRLKEDSGTRTTSKMLSNLISDNQEIAQSLRSLLPIVETAFDGATADILNARLQAHEKNIWMLKSSI